MCDVESPHNLNSASIIGSFYTYSSSGSIVFTLSVGLEFDAYSRWICGLVLSQQLSAPSNYELEPSDMTIWLFLCFI